MRNKTKFKTIPFLLAVTLIYSISVLKPVLATSYTETSAVSVTVNESVSFFGPGNWTAGAALPGSTYVSRSSANMAWIANASYTLSTEIPFSGLINSFSNTISNHSGTIAAPTALTTGEAWGFSLSNVAGSAVESKWDNGGNFAAFPPTTTTVYSSSDQDTTGTSWAVYWKAITLSTTESGTYTTTVTWTFTTTI
jgi:hypothetical protein